MFQIYRKEIDWGGRKLTLETGKVTSSRWRDYRHIGRNICSMYSCCCKVSKAWSGFLSIDSQLSGKAAFAAGKIQVASSSVKAAHQKMRHWYLA